MPILLARVTKSSANTPQDEVQHEPDHEEEDNVCVNNDWGLKNVYQHYNVLRRTYQYFVGLFLKIQEMCKAWPCKNSYTIQSTCVAKSPMADKDKNNDIDTILLLLLLLLLFVVCCC